MFAQLVQQQILVGRKKSEILKTLIKIMLTERKNIEDK